MFWFLKKHSSAICKLAITQLSIDRLIFYIWDTYVSEGLDLKIERDCITIEMTSSAKMKSWDIGVDETFVLNLSPPSAAYTRRWIGSPIRRQAII